MFFVKSILMTTFSLCLVAAHAAESGLIHSEPLHQAEEAAVELTPGIGVSPAFQQTSFAPGYTSGQFKYRDSTLGKVQLDIVPVDLMLEYGLNSMFSLGAGLEYMNERVTFPGCTRSDCSGYTKKGLSDPLLFVKGRLAAGPGVFQYGLFVSVGVEKQKIERSGNRNAGTGKNTVTPYVAYQLSLGGGVGGGRVNYDAYQSDSKSTLDTEIGSVSYSTSGARTLAGELFYEMPFEGLTLGAAVKYASTDTTKLKVNGSTVDQDSAVNQLSLTLYAPIHFERMTLTPDLQYLNGKFTSSQSSASSGTLLAAGLSARATF